MLCFNICSLQSRNKFALLPFLYRFIPSLSQPNLTQLNSPHQPVQSALSMKLISGHSSSSKSKFTTQALDLNSRSEVSMGAVQLSAAVYTLQFAQSLAFTCLGSSPVSEILRRMISSASASPPSQCPAILHPYPLEHRLPAVDQNT